MTATAPTLHQVAVLAFIATHRTVSSPTIREIGQRFAIKSTNGVSDLLVALKKRGCLDHDKGQARTFRVTRQGMAELGAHFRYCELCGAEVAS